MQVICKQRGCSRAVPALYMPAAVLWIASNAWLLYLCLFFIDISPPAPPTLLIVPMLLVALVLVICSIALKYLLREIWKKDLSFFVCAGGAALGFDFQGIVAVVLVLTPKDFYKSMTTHADHRVWQDVYRPTTPAGEVYLKLTVVQDVLIVSFKEL